MAESMAAGRHGAGEVAESYILIYRQKERREGGREEGRQRGRVGEGGGEREGQGESHLSL